MCGILGQINRHASIDQGLFLSMLDTLDKRGPDQSGTFFDGRIALGQRRLSIIDLSEAGKQPMFNEDGDISVVFNGEIYNYKDASNILKEDHSWKSKSDTEFLIHGYEELGSGIVDRIEGMFSFAIYDKRRGILTLARDHFGKKPLYYYLDDEIFCFASEIKAIIKNPEIKKKLKIDKLSLEKFIFYGYVPSPNSIFINIKKLEPATVIRFDIKSWTLKNKRKYWELEKVGINNDMTEDEILGRTEQLIRKSVEKRLMADVPLGVFLSGGVDSSLIAAYLSEISDNVSSFTVCYKDYHDADESEYAEKVARKLGLRPNLCYLDSASVRESFIEIMDYLDEPLADAAIVPLYFVSKLAKNKITVALGGDGGDEIFGGYSKYRAQLFIERNKCLGFAAGIGRKVFPNGSAYRKMLDCFEMPFPERQFVFGSGSFLIDEAENLIGRSVDARRIFAEAWHYDGLFEQNDNMNRSLYLDAKIQLPDWYLVKGDRATMAASLEMRNPLLDKNLAEFAFSLSGKWKIRNGVQKYILKKLAERHIDGDIIYRRKSGFGVPMGEWIKNELNDIFEDYLFLDNGFFDLKFVKAMHYDHMNGVRNRQFELFRIFSFNYFFKNIFG